MSIIDLASAAVDYFVHAVITAAEFPDPGTLESVSADWRRKSPEEADNQARLRAHRLYWRYEAGGKDRQAAVAKGAGIFGTVTRIGAMDAELHDAIVKKWDATHADDLLQQLQSWAHRGRELVYPGGVNTANIASSALDKWIAEAAPIRVALNRLKAGVGQTAEQEQPAPLSNDLVPVKTKYPGRPPASEPRWLHLDWIQTTAAILADEWEKIIECRANWTRLRSAGLNLDDNPQVQWEMEQWRHLWEEVLPLWQESLAYVDREVWEVCEHIAGPHDAERSPKQAAAEWRRVRNHAQAALEKLTAGQDATAEAIRDVRDARVLFDRWATMRTNYELAANDPEDRGRSFPPKSKAEATGLLLAFQEKAKSLIPLAERYGVDAGALRTICYEINGGEDKDKRANVRAVLDKLEGAMLRPVADPIRANQSRETADGLFSSSQLAAQWKIDPEATRKALDRWREKHAGGDGYQENTDRRPNEPKYLYSAKAVNPVMESLQSRATRRSIRRTKTSSKLPPRRN